MAEPIGLASGLLALAVFALQSSTTLYNTVKSFQSHPSRVRDLIEELEALSGVLAPLTETVSATTDIDLSALDLPLLRCGNACKEFGQELAKCSSRSSGNRTSFRDWAKLRYMGEDIDGFRRLLSGYKLTINIALTDANLRKSSITTESLEGYNDLLKTATADLEAHLESIDEKLEIVFGQTLKESSLDAAEQHLLKEEQLSTQKCLQICAQLSDHINQIQLTDLLSGSPSGPIDPDNFPERLTNGGLQECKNGLSLIAAKLERHMRDLVGRLVAKSRTAMASEEEITDLVRLQDEWETTRRCMDIYSKADNLLKENISNIENYATGDAVQFMVSTDGKTIHGRNRGVGWRSRQVGGHLSDVSLRQISQDMTRISIRNIGDEGLPPRGRTPPASGNGVESGPVPEFRERWGRGFTLAAKSAPTVTMSSTRPVESEQQNSSPNR